MISVMPAPRADRASVDASATAWALAARGGDPDAADHFVRALHADVLRYVTYLSGDPQTAHDLTQDTFARAFGSLHRYEGRASARTWLLSIARRAVADSLRRAAVRPRIADTVDWQTAVEGTQPRGLPGFDDGIALLDLLETLPDERREAFLLTQVVGLSYEEAAGFTGCPIGTVRSRVSRARATLERVLREAESASTLDG
ncbi:sigma-70 family RNA polymerase sigma factor [Streptomyces griseofuscus]|uniref:sigma-70 family RNA polymerase sigma factor n=2 Tax=Streptomyces TaxID=1883 RepID=UPI00081E6BF9|nr:sigma-70 family RNA polymerase sigma factor [Streptomyces sp. CRPSP2-6A1]MYQ93076.1 sigma-70 family RNA polymerase sigma factor [Streptomyces sp. SID4946]SCF78921.1 RNA polymerase sigma-70 factor, ECF subfamily [Streptomyces sp. DconLS]SCF84264.1 RNA polymerase sigma-70 factor, ECF subfamily [Streptomyces sp. LamerLS-31b]